MPRVKRAKLGGLSNEEDGRAAVETGCRPYLRGLERFREWVKPYLGILVDKPAQRQAAKSQPAGLD